MGAASEFIATTSSTVFIGFDATCFKDENAVQFRMYGKIRAFPALPFGEVQQARDNARSFSAKAMSAFIYLVIQM